jgi:hypothetical protein
VETDFDLFSIAKNCISVPENLFYREDYDNYQKYDIFVIFHPTAHQLYEIMQVEKTTFVVFSESDDKNMQIENIKDYGNFKLGILNGEKKI